jgi:lipopolysaccharide/colanic/teichoic acid biosynthesis glycosyltransferase
MRVRRLARLLLYAGIIGTVAGLSKLHAARIGGYDYTNTSRFAWSIAYMAVLGLTAYGLGLPDVPRTRRSAWASAAGASLGAALGVSVLQLLVGDALLPRFVVLGSALILVPWFVICASVAQDGRSRGERRDRVVLVGGPAEAVILAAELDRYAERPAQVVGALSVDEARTAGAVSGDPALPLVALAEAESATVVVLDRDAQNDETVVAQAARLHEGGMRIRTLSLFYEEWLAKLPLSELERVSLMFDIGEVHRVRYGRVKRMLDVVLGLAGMVALALVVPFVAVGNLLANRGPLLYRQERVGKNGAPFQILKLRTMRPATEGGTSDWTAVGDPRITPFGHLLRAAHLDELPQVVNILRGDLSVVGPRPEQPRYVEELGDKLPFYDLRHLVRPGLTGWAQVKFGYAGDESDALQKLQYEFFYLRHQRLSLDLRIVARTVRSVLGRRGR